ncbi:GNAT family N-acetyltransferase [Microbacterium mitrae]|uniref:GNAT family N-acetyltransferase n=1 Tax=Microbacterium mitrae TaxID=664640 RepID=UPI001FE7F104|nr:GNAT family N-acetyltransferase [Microbacterium mitrae]
MTASAVDIAPLTTERLVLTLASARDIDDIVDACQDPTLREWTALPSPYERADAEWFVAHTTQAERDDRARHWVIRASGRLLGVASLTRSTPDTAELGFWIIADARRQRYMTEAAAAVIDNGFAIDGMRLDRIEWNGAVGNVASARTARALGFQYEGVRRGAMLTPRGRVDAWVAGLLFHDARKRTPWPVLAR